MSVESGFPPIAMPQPTHQRRLPAYGPLQLTNGSHNCEGLPLDISHVSNQNISCIRVNRTMTQNFHCGILLYTDRAAY